VGDGLLYGLVGGAHPPGDVGEVLQVDDIPFQAIGDQMLEHPPAFPHGLDRGVDLPPLAHGHRLVDEPAGRGGVDGVLLGQGDHRPDIGHQGGELLLKLLLLVLLARFLGLRLDRLRRFHVHGMATGRTGSALHGDHSVALGALLLGHLFNDELHTAFRTAFYLSPYVCPALRTIELKIGVFNAVGGSRHHGPLRGELNNQEILS